MEKMHLIKNFFFHFEIDTIGKIRRIARNAWVIVKREFYAKQKVVIFKKHVIQCNESLLLQLQPKNANRKKREIKKIKILNEKNVFVRILHVEPIH